jgi:hypothetical protein
MDNRIVSNPKKPMFDGRPMTHKLVILAYQVPVPGIQKLVLMALAENTRADGSNAYPSLDTIAGRIGFCRRSVQAALKALEAAGWIIPTRRKGGRACNCYTLAVERMRNAVTRNPAKLAENPEPDGPENQAGDASFPSQETRQEVPERRHEMPTPQARDAYEQVPFNKNSKQVSSADAPPTGLEDERYGGFDAWVRKLDPVPWRDGGELNWYTRNLMAWRDGIVRAGRLWKEVETWNVRSWEPLGDWIRDGYSLTEIQTQIAEQMTHRKDPTKPVKGLAFFNGRIRERLKPVEKRRHRTAEDYAATKAPEPTPVAPAAADCLEREAVPATAAPEPQPVQAPAQVIEYACREWAVNAAKKAGKRPIDLEFYEDDTGWHWRDRPQVSPEEEERIAEENVVRQLAAMGIGPDELAKRRAEMAAASEHRARLLKEVAEHLAAKAAAGD